MSDDHLAPAPPLRGLDPARVLDAVSGPARVLPVVPGWHVVAVAGEGGMGLVWRGVREGDGAEGAIKLAAGRDLDVVERIEGEAKALRALEHPNIVRLLDAGPMEDGGLFLAMEFVHGPPLAHIIPAGGLPAEKVFAIFRNIAAAVEHAHSRGILHRDLKPANVLLCTRTKSPLRDGKEGDFFAKVADFGMAKPVHERVQKMSLTHTGLVAGTAEYIPPEAYLQGHVPDVAADIYALGVILYEMLAGTPPRGAWQPVSKLRPVDVRLDEVLAKAMNAKPELRWKSAGAMLAAVEEILRTPPRLAGTPLVTGATRTMDFFWTLIGGLVLFLVICTLVRLDKGTIPVPVDLIGKNSPRTGGYQALFFLLCVLAPAGIWQIARLWRFRHVPLREALPSPFGIRLGTSRTAAVLVALANYVFLIAPATGLYSLWIKVGRSWVHEDSPPWATGLCVTRSMHTKGEAIDETAIIPMWQLPERNVNYWLYELQGQPGSPMCVRYGRVSYLPFFVPLVMSLCAGALAGSAGCVLLHAAYGWSLRRRWWRASGFVCTALMAGGIAATDAREEWARARAEYSPERWDPWVKISVPKMHQQLARYFSNAASAESMGPLPPSLARRFTSAVDYCELGVIPRERVLEELEAARLRDVAANQINLDNHISHEQGRPTPDSNRWRLELEVTSIEVKNPPALENSRYGKAKMEQVRRLMYGSYSMDEDDTMPDIDRLKVIRKTIYESQNRMATVEEAKAWCRRLDEALHHPPKQESAEPLIGCFHTTLYPGSGYFGSLMIESNARETPDRFAKALRSIAGSAAAETIEEPLQFLPGGRTQVRFQWQGAGEKQTGHAVAELILTGDEWRCVRLTFEPTKL